VTSEHQELIHLSKSPSGGFEEIPWRLSWEIEFTRFDPYAHIGSSDFRISFRLKCPKFKSNWTTLSILQLPPDVCWLLHQSPPKLAWFFVCVCERLSWSDLQLWANSPDWSGKGKPTASSTCRPSATTCINIEWEARLTRGTQFGVNNLLKSHKFARIKSSNTKVTV